jgi:hypothetical protein
VCPRVLHCNLPRCAVLVRPGPCNRDACVPTDTATKSGARVPSHKIAPAWPTSEQDAPASSRTPSPWRGARSSFCARVSAIQESESTTTTTPPRNPGRKPIKGHYSQGGGVGKQWGRLGEMSLAGYELSRRQHGRHSDGVCANVAGCGSANSRRWLPAGAKTALASPAPCIPTTTLARRKMRTACAPSQARCTASGQGGIVAVCKTPNREL